MTFKIVAIASSLALLSACSTTTTTTKTEPVEAVSVASTTITFQTNNASIPTIEIMNECIPYTVVKDNYLIGFTPRYFAVNEETAKKISVKENQCIADILQEYPLKVELQGFTDSTGNKYYNQKLAKRRAKSVQKELISAGVSQQSILLVENAKTMEVKTMESLNRRVNLTVK